jgi:hypothetical protein
LKKNNNNCLRFIRIVNYSKMSSIVIIVNYHPAIINNKRLVAISKHILQSEDMYITVAYPGGHRGHAPSYWPYSLFFVLKIYIYSYTWKHTTICHKKHQQNYNSQIGQNNFIQLLLLFYILIILFGLKYPFITIYYYIHIYWLNDWLKI